jgi:predicted nucleic acid-binding protein
VDLITDASSIINLHNANALGIVTRLPPRILCVSPQVIGECHAPCVADLVVLKEQGLVQFVSPDTISAELYLNLLETYDLGEGETECLALAHGHPFVICCDDNKARRVGVELFGQARVVGSLRLLRWAVQDGLIKGHEAFSCYEAMKNAGGFLPDVPATWFDHG